MKIIIENVDLVHVHNACHNALKSSNGIQGRTRLRLDEIIEAIRPKRESFQRHWAGEVEQQVLHIDGEPQLSAGQYIFKSDDHEEKYMDFVQMERTIDIELLGREELRNIITTQDQFASADDHFRALQLVTEGYANIPEKEETETEKEE